VLVADHLSEAPARLKRGGVSGDRMIDASELASLELSHVSTRVVLPTVGWTHWEVHASSGPVSIRWPWEMLQRGVLCISNPMSIEVGASLTSSEGVPLGASLTAMLGSRAVARTSWHAVVLQCIDQGAALTDREAQCFRAVVSGLTTKEAGQRMGVSPQTVSNCLSSAYKKLGIRNRGAAMREALRLAIIPLP
jgi:DNA-binding CsgD family transcriptional regulator